MSIEFIFASLLLALLPGPDILYVLTQSVSRGFKAAFCVSLGLVSGLFVHTAAVAFGVAALVAASPKLLQGLQYLGALYLFWLGVGAVRSGGGTPAVTCEGAAQETHTGAWFYRTGIIMNLLNPKVILFFLSFFPGFLPAGEVHVWRQTFGLGDYFCGCYTERIYECCCLGWVVKPSFRYRALCCQSSFRLGYGRCVLVNRAMDCI